MPQARNEAGCEQSDADTREAACSPAYALACALMHGDPFDNADMIAAAAKEAGVLVTYPRGDDGYVDAFYRIAAELGLGSALPYSPEHVFEHEILPRLRSIIDMGAELEAKDAALAGAKSILELWRYEALQQCGRPGMAWMSLPIERTAGWLKRNEPPPTIPRGTMECPHCGKSTPHHHTPDEIATITLNTDGDENG